MARRFPLLVLLVLGLVGCSSSPPIDCAEILVRYQALCPADRQYASEILETTCSAFDEDEACTIEEADLRACWGDGFDMMAGAVCGLSLLESACAPERDALYTCRSEQSGFTDRARCIGNAVSCRDLDLARCETQIGCSIDGDRCTGNAESCGGFRGDTLCDPQIGCSWDQPDVYAGDCIGRAVICDRLLPAECGSQLECTVLEGACDGQTSPCPQTRSPELCDSRPGCAWEPPALVEGRCIGDATECRALEAPECDAQLGCLHRAGECDGVVELCRNFNLPDSCAAQRGCVWDGA